MKLNIFSAAGGCNASLTSNLFSSAVNLFILSEEKLSRFISFVIEFGSRRRKADDGGGGGASGRKRRRSRGKSNLERVSKSFEFSPLLPPFFVRGACLFLFGRGQKCVRDADFHSSTPTRPARARKGSVPNRIS